MASHPVLARGGGADAPPSPPFYVVGEQALLLATSSPSIRALYATAIENCVRGLPRPSADHLRCPRDVTLPPNGSAMLDLGVVVLLIERAPHSPLDWYSSKLGDYWFASSDFVRKQPILLSVEGAGSLNPVVVRVSNISGKNIRIKAGTPLVSVYSTYIRRPTTPVMTSENPIDLYGIKLEFLYQNYLSYTGQALDNDE